MASTNKKKHYEHCTLNLCLGLKNKKLEVENLMSQNEISILCMQEIEIESNYDPSVLNIKS